MPEILGTSKSISGFDPRSIPGCLMWLEPTQFTGTGTSTVWADKSGNGYNMSYSSSYTSPPVLNTTNQINGNNVVSFTGTSACRLTGNITFPNSERTIFIVLRPTGMTSSAGANISLFGPGSGGYLSMSMSPYTGTYPYYWFLTNTGNYQVMATQSGTFPTLNNVCMMAAVNATSAASNVLTLNGVTQALDNANNAASYNGGSTNQYLGGGASGTVGNWDCCEMIFYSTAITPTQRQQVEGYLAWKWGIEVVPQATIAPAVTPLNLIPGNPTDIPGCALWLDATDSSTMTFSSGSNISQWRDKSSFSNNATAYNSPVLTANAINGMQAISTSNLPYFNGSISITGTTFTVFAVATTTRTLPNTGSDQRLVSLENGTNVDYGRTDGAIALFNQSSSSWIGTWRVSGPIASNTIVTNTPFLAVSKYDGTNGYLWLNGTAGSLASNASSGTFAVTKYGIGNQANNSGEYWTGYIGEIIIYTGALTDTQRQQVEGYLGRKWGITTPPTVSTASISSKVCQVWLDASDTTTLFQDTAGTTAVTADGQSVACWKDKSVNAYSFTQATSGNRPTFKTSVLNGNNTLRWNGTSQYLQSSTTLPFFTTTSSGGTFFFVFNASQISAQRCLLHYQNSVSGTYCSDETDIAYTTGAQTQGNFGFHRGCGYAAVALNQVNQTMTNENLLMTGVLGTTGSTPANVQIFKNGRSSTVQNDSSGYYSAGSYPSSNNSRYMIIGSRYLYGTTPDCYHLGDIAEVIWFNIALTSVQRQQIESYLSTKWGIAMYGNGYTPLLQSPTTIPYCKVWFDGSDPAGTGVKPADGASISTWVDKSGNGYNATVASGKTAATFSAASNCVYFPASTTGYATSYPANPTNETVFVVFNNPSPSFNNNILIGGQQGARSLGAGYSGSGGVNVVGNLNNEVAWLAATPASSYPSGTTTLVTCQFTSTSNGIGLNGKAYSTGGSPGFYGSTTTYLGVDTTTSAYYYIGYAMEIIFFSNTLNTIQRQAVERYLSLKWNIPNFYTSIPGSVSGLQFWMDGADTSTMTFPSGSNISGIADKATLGLTLSNLNSGYYPTFVSGLGVYLSNSSSTSQVTCQSLNNNTVWYVPTQNMTMFVAYKANSTDNLRAPVLLGGGNAFSARPNFAFQIQCGASEGTNSVWDLTGGSWTLNVTNNSNTSTGLRVESMVSTPGATSGFNFINGIESVYSTNTSPYTSTYTNYPAVIQLGQGSLIGGRIFNGYIQEILFYSNALTSTERKVAESYLARKWGNTSVPTQILPQSHPFTYIAPLTRAFSPSDISGCALWLDVSDRSTTVSGSSLTGIIDKSGNYLTTTLSSTAPTYSATQLNGYPGINFTGASWIRGNFASTYTGSNFIVFAVGSMTTASAGYRRLVSFSLPSTYDYASASQVIPILQQSGNAVIESFRTADQAGKTVSYSTNYLLEAEYTGSSNNFYLNGGTPSSVASSGAFNFNEWGVGYLADYGGTSDAAYWNGNFGEVIVYFGSLTSTQRQQVEGYLAWKWGLQGSLASTHPFYKFPSSSAVPFLPTNITNCSLWLDASAPNEFNTFSFGTGSNVRVWYDKSGSNNHATATAGAYPTYSYASNCVVWNGTSSSQLVLDTNISNSVVNRAFTIFVVSQRTVGSENFFMRGTNTANNSNLLIGHGGSTATTIRFAYYGNDLDYGSVPTYTTGELPSIICFQYSKPNRAIYYNGSLGVSDTNSTDLASWTGAMVGGGGGSWLAYQGKIFEIIIYGAVLTTAQRQMVEGYLAQKWGI